MTIRGGCAALLAAAVIMVLATGCGGAASGSPTPEEPDVLVAAIPTVDLASLYIAQDDGLFAQQGLHVTIEKIASSAAIIADQLKGQIDIGAASYVPYIAAQATGARFRILAEASTLKPGCRELVIGPNSPVTAIGDLAGKKIGVNGTNSIGTLLISALLAEHGVSPKTVHFITDQKGFPAMPGQLEGGAWDAAFLAEPYVTIAGEQYGERVLADLDQGATRDFAIDGYVATQAWVHKYPKTAAAFVRAIEEGQALANSEPGAVQAAMARSDNLPLKVTALMSLPGFPTGPVDEERIQREAQVMLQFGVLGTDYTAQVRQGTLAASMVTPAP
ncbi:MAG TPA: ABC transporter substrate-binding protein [Streptosporangiaceae bacterium]|nr:ABC transporter substrate-binding protein [Streptosporangiaceae bacterium]